MASAAEVPRPTMPSYHPEPLSIDRLGDTSPDLGAPPPTGGEKQPPSLVVVYSRDLRELCRRFALDPRGAPYFVGRGESCFILLDNPQVSRLHARIELRGEEWWIVDVGSRNGTWVNDRQIRALALRPGDRVRTGATVFKFMAGSDAEAEYLEAIRAAMRTDSLTQALTHAAFREALATEHARSRRYNRPLSVVMIDLDHFKAVNDTLGHLAGDHALRQFAGVVRARIRRGEEFGRLGGEEFALLLPETALDGAQVLGADLQRRIEEHSFEHEGHRVTMTASFGIATLTQSMETPEALLERADQMLYAAKHAGRNQLVVDRPTG